MQTKETALNARRKMGSYLMDEDESETPDSREVLQKVLQTPEGKYPNSLHLLEKNGGSDGTRTRDLSRDRRSL